MLSFAFTEIQIQTTADNWESSDEAFGALANACAQAGPSVCDLTREGWSGADVVTYLQSALAVSGQHFWLYPLAHC